MMNLFYSEGLVVFEITAVNTTFPRVCPFDLRMFTIPVNFLCCWLVSIERYIFSAIV